MEVPKFRLASGPVAHHRCFARGYNVYLQARGGSTVFAVNEDRLRQRAVIAARILDEARSTLGSSAGGSTAQAIEILNLDTTAMGHYLELISAESEEERADLQSRETWATIYGILKASVILFDPLSRRYALSRLDHLSEFTPMRRLTIAIDFRIGDWFVPAAIAVVRKAIDHWTSQDYDALSGDTLRRVMEIKTRLMKARSHTLLYPPIADACIRCEFGSLCRKKWEIHWEEWGSSALEVYLDTPLPASTRDEVLARIEDHRESVCESCWEANKALVAQEFARESNLVNTLVTDWRVSLRFNSVEAAVQDIRRRSQAYEGMAGILLDHDLEYLTLSSEGLGGLLDD